MMQQGGFGLDIGRIMIGGVLGIIAFLVAFQVWTPLNNATDSFYLDFVGSCENSLGARFLRAYPLVGMARTQPRPISIRPRRRRFPTLAVAAAPSRTA